MNAEYDQVADKYELMFKALPYREHIEAYSVFQSLGDVTGLSVFDAACGTGIYTREIRRRGAAQVFGVDISEEMIQVARSMEEANPLGVTYAVQDVSMLNDSRTFDCAVAIYLLHYANSKEQLLKMCKTIAKSIKPQARFLTYQFNPDISKIPGYYKKYGLDLQISQEPSDGMPFTFTVTIGGMVSPKFTAYYWSKTALENALKEAGFTNIRWNKPTVSKQGAEQYGSDFWQTYLDYPHCMLLECINSCNS